MSYLQLFPPWRIAQLQAINEANLGAASGIGADIVIRRAGVSNLEAQPVRIVATQESTERSSATTQAQIADVLVIGATGLDIQAKDKFNDTNNVLYEVIFVRPGRAFNTVAEARAV